MDVHKCGSDYCAADGKEKMQEVIFLIHYSTSNTTQSETPLEVHAQQVTTDNKKINLNANILYYQDKSFLII